MLNGTSAVALQGSSSPGRAGCWFRRLGAAAVRPRRHPQRWCGAFGIAAPVEWTIDQLQRRPFPEVLAFVAETLKVRRKPGAAHGGVTSSSSTSGRPQTR
jgi:hypothetical protein